MNVFWKQKRTKNMYVDDSSIKQNKHVSISQVEILHVHELYAGSKKMVYLLTSFFLDFCEDKYYLFFFSFLSFFLFMINYLLIFATIFYFLFLYV